MAIDDIDFKLIDFVVLESVPIPLIIGNQFLMEKLKINIKQIVADKLKETKNLHETLVADFPTKIDPDIRLINEEAFKSLIMRQGTLQDES